MCGKQKDPSLCGSGRIMKIHRISYSFCTFLLAGILSLTLFTGKTPAAYWPDRDLVYGMTGEDVAILQSTLTSLGYWVGDIDGYFGELTYYGLCQYQSDRGLYVDGVAGSITYGSLYGTQTPDPSFVSDAAVPDTYFRSLWRGMIGDDVYQLQSLLQGVGYWAGGADGYFGGLTETAVIQYQSDHGLFVDGIAGPETLNSLYNAISAVSGQYSEIYENTLPRELQRGMSGADVTALQSMLLQMGYAVGDIDGEFGAYTEAAVKAYQKDHGNLCVDGIVGAQTRRTLDSDLTILSGRKKMIIHDAVLALGSSYTIQPVFADGMQHTVTLSTNSRAISISGMTVTAVAKGTAEVRAECEGEVITFFVGVSDQAYIESRFGTSENALEFDNGLEYRLQNLEIYDGDTDTMVLFAGDSYLDERLYLTDYNYRFFGGNIYSSAISGSTARQWSGSMSQFYEYQPASLVMNLGINDIRQGQTAAEVINDLESLFGSVSKNMPDTTVYWWTIAPQIGAGDEYYKIAAVNSAIREYSAQNSNLVVVDSYGALTDSNGLPNGSLYKDNLHPNNKGYDRIFQKTYQAGLKVTQSTK